MSRARVQCASRSISSSARSSAARLHAAAVGDNDSDVANWYVFDFRIPFPFCNKTFQVQVQVQVLVGCASTRPVMFPWREFSMRISPEMLWAQTYIISIVTHCATIERALSPIAVRGPVLFVLTHPSDSLPCFLPRVIVMFFLGRAHRSDRRCHSSWQPCLHWLRGARTHMALERVRAWTIFTYKLKCT